MKNITVGIPSYSNLTEHNDDGKWMIHFGLNLRDNIESIVPCEQVCIASDGLFTISMGNDSLQRFVNNNEDLCFPHNLLLSGDLVLVLQDMIRHSRNYTGKRHLNGVTFYFSPSFVLTLQVQNVLLLIDGKLKCYVDLDILLLYSTLMSLSLRTLDPLLRHQYRNLVVSCREDNNGEHECDSFIMKTFVLSLKEICSVKVANLLTKSTDSNGVLCFLEKVCELELPWNFSENLMSERCICFRPQEVVKAHPEWNCTVFEKDMLHTISHCQHDEQTDRHIHIETVLKNCKMCLKRKDFNRLQMVLKNDACTSWQWHTYLITGESLIVAIDKYLGTARLYLLKNFAGVLELRQITLTSNACETIQTLSV